MIALTALWLIGAALLTRYLWSDIAFALTELRDPWSALILLGTALFWPLAAVLLVVTVVRDFWKSTC